MPFTLATWNINSVRLRLPIVERFLSEYAPDVLCLQETKCPDDLFPHEAFAALGYGHVAVNGQKGYHGVAILSRLPLAKPGHIHWCDKEDCRHVFATLPGGIELHNLYIPAGGDIPDVEQNPKFRHKLDFVEEMRTVPADDPRFAGSILVGDLNIAPLENDVWSHKQLLNVVSHTPIETTSFEAMRHHAGWVDLMREKIPAEEKIYTWWSYRAQDWALSDRGRRLDHVWSSAGIVADLADIEIVRAARGWDRPSDHVPVIARFAWE